MLAKALSTMLLYEGFIFVTLNFHKISEVMFDLKYIICEISMNVASLCVTGVRNCENQKRFMKN